MNFYRQGQRRSYAFSLLELLMTISIMGILFAILLPGLIKAQQSAQKASCQNNLKQWGMIFKMYASESPGARWPPMQCVRGEGANLTFSLATGPSVRTLFPEYLNDARIIVCPSDPDKEGMNIRSSESLNILALKPEYIDTSYAYFGWIFDKADRQAVPASSFNTLLIIASRFGVDLSKRHSPYNAQILAAIAAMLRNVDIFNITLPETLKRMNQDIFGVPSHPLSNENLGNGDSEIIFRIREGAERFLTIEGKNSKYISQSQVWVMFDSPVSLPGGIRLNHTPGGSNVLFMDGHVEYVGFVPGRWNKGAFYDNDAIPPVCVSIAYLLKEMERIP